ncbi:response regulator transcription factor [Sulfurovum sp. zt1-1]|uniref:Response regulator transcription factor n=1 Tax=Sulfurovum zhangzhouensis TaxID=3019067 RepID=A0ABT7QXN8_9BACT|nr:response regulator transcription factor [Sulfurovum zhangzhouensis]MDM5271586.1 response regulator transcription factor [Sulfurovum zhangzhouensis]
MHLLVVEDEHTVADQLKQLLEQERYSCDVAYNYRDALELIDEKNYDLILLDWNLPDGDGLSLLKLMREENTNTPVLMLSAKSEIDDRVEILDAGGDDYLSKPYSNIELFARIRALLRRDTTQKNTLLQCKELTLDTRSHEVKVSGNPIHLSQTEYSLLELLMQNKNIVLTRYQLNEHICREYNSLKQSNLVDVHIKNLRKKIGIEDCIMTVRGVGYTIKDK